MQVCKCGKPVDNIETALNYKLIGREVKSFLCAECLSARLRIPVGELYRFASDQRRRGCLIFDLPESEYENWAKEHNIEV